ncbi:unnamed protein product [Closterium sp. NIES-53]
MQVESAAILVARKRPLQHHLKEKRKMDGGAGAGVKGVMPSTVAEIVDMNAKLMPANRLVLVNSNSVVAALMYWISCILQWVRDYGSDSISEKECFKDNPQSKVCPMRHPLRDLPSLLLVRFGAIPKPLEGRNVPLEWEEWPGGDEAAVKFPVNRKERCFGLGIVEERGEAPEKLTQDPPQHTSEAGRDGRRAKDAEGQGGSHEGEWSMARGIAEAGGGGRSARRRDSKAIELGGWEKSLKSKERAIAEEFPTADVRVTVLPPSRRKLPIVLCLADVDFLVEVTGSVMDPPACAHCKACSADFMLYVCTVALIANFAYRPVVSHLFSRVLSLFLPPSLGFDELVDCLEFPARLHWPLNLHMLLRRAEQVPVYFLVQWSPR